MFTYHCPQCASRRLIFPSMITGLANTDHGIELGFTCWCGSAQTVITGKAAPRPTVVEHFAA